MNSGCLWKCEASGPTMEGLERTGKHLGADFIRSQVLLFARLSLLPVNCYLLPLFFTRFNDKSGTVGLSIPKSDHLIRIADDLQIPPQRHTAAIFLIVRQKLG